MGESLVHEGSSSIDILQQIRDRGEEPFQKLFEQYLTRLTALVRSRMAARLARKIDPEDIVLSAFRSFFVANRDGRFEIESETSLWQILVTISLRKLSKQADHFKTAKRSIEKEFDSVSSLIAKAPTAEEAAMLEEELFRLLASLNFQDRQIVELRLQGKTLGQISQKLQISERTVRRTLKRIIAERSDSLNPFETSQLRSISNLASELGPVEIPEHLKPTLISEFVIHSHIGSGGMGKVYFATRVADQHPVAIKFLKKRFLSNFLYVQRFLQEASLLQDLDHPNIVKFHGVGKVQRHGIFIVMEWIKEASSLLKRPKPLQQTEVVQLCLQAAKGLLFAHNKKIIHCDVSPGNMLLNSEGKLLLSDFGLACKNLETLQVRTGTFGTAAFLSPEQASIEWGKVSPKTDVYGLGATMYYLLTGSIPFPSSTVPEMMRRLLSKETPEPIRQQNSSVTQALEEICIKCLQKEQQRRPEMKTVLNWFDSQSNLISEQK